MFSKMLKQFAIALTALCLTVGAAYARCPEIGRPIGDRFTVREGFRIDPQVHRVTAGGSIDLSRCPSVPGTSRVSKRPDFVVDYKTRNGGLSSFTLTFRVESKADTVLLINGPHGQWYYNDDSGRRLNAKLSFPNAAPGRYDVWVGTYTQGLSNAKLLITELE